MHISRQEATLQLASHAPKPKWMSLEEEMRQLKSRQLWINTPQNVVREVGHLLAGVWGPHLINEDGD